MNPHNMDSKTVRANVRCCAGAGVCCVRVRFIGGCVGAKFIELNRRLNWRWRWQMRLNWVNPKRHDMRAWLQSCDLARYQSTCF